MKINFKLIQLIYILIIGFSCTERKQATEPIDNNNIRTELKGSISGDLSISNSPYLVVDTIKVNPNDTVYIHPGVKIEFTDSASMIISGVLKAIGSKDKFIQFTSQVDSWKGIRFLNSNKNSKIQFAKINHVSLSDSDSTDFGAIEVNNSSLTIMNCIIQNNKGNNGAGISAINSDVVIKNSIFQQNEALTFGGGVLLYNSNAKVYNNTFYDNFTTNYGAGIAIYQDLNEDIQNNLFYNNVGNTGYTQIYCSNLDSVSFYFNQSYNFISTNDPNPHFVSETDLRLSYNSPCINAGNPDPKYNDTDNTRNDQGAYGGPDGDW